RRGGFAPRNLVTRAGRPRRPFGASAPPAFAADPWPIPGRFRATLPLAGQPAAIPSLPLFPPRASFGSRRAGRAGTRFDPVIAFSRFAGYIFRISGRHGGGIP
ncbi:hypothetical protein, partial [Burkholderia sp. Cy-647]